MAITVESISTKTFAAGQSMVITKPTGLAVGDLMIAHCSSISPSNSNPADYNTPTGWTSVNTTSSTNSSLTHSNMLRIFSKVADSSDVAASDFTFTISGGSNRNLGGAIYRISGFGPTTPVPTSNAASNSGTNDHDTSPLTLNATVTPSRASSLIMMLITASSDASAFGSYAVATDDPTWTEGYDFNSGALNAAMAGAYATRTETSATGSSTFGYSGSAVKPSLVMVVINPTQDVTVSADVVTTPAAVQAPTIAGGGVVAAGLVSATASVVAPTAGENKWRNASRTAATASNASKTAATASNVSKNAATASNINKS